MPARRPCDGTGNCAIPAIEAKLDEIIDELRVLKTAFPETEYGEADVAGHRKYHDAKIAAAQAEAEFWHELKLDLAKKGSWALFLIILGLIVAGLGFGRHTFPFLGR